MDSLYKIEVDFVLRCPLSYSIPSGSSAYLRARRFAPSYLYFCLSKRTLKHKKGHRSTMILKAKNRGGDECFRLGG